MAQLIINIPDDQVTRIRAAFGKILQTKDANGDPRPATQAEIKDWIIGRIKYHVRVIEDGDAYDQARATAEASIPPSPDIT